MPVAQLRVCTILQAGARSISAMAEELGTSLSAVTQLADRLERSGMVERIPESDDRRSRKLQLTPHGTEVMKARRRIRVRRLAAALARLPESTRMDVLESLEALRLAAVAARAAAEGGEAPMGVVALNGNGLEIGSELISAARLD